MTGLDRVKALLLDLSGVVYVQDEAVPGAAEALERLREDGLPIRLVTNTTMRPRRSIMERLEALAGQLDKEAGALGDRDAERLRGIADVIRRRLANLRQA